MAQFLATEFRQPECCCSALLSLDSWQFTKMLSGEPPSHSPLASHSFRVVVAQCVFGNSFTRYYTMFYSQIYECWGVRKIPKAVYWINWTYKIGLMLWEDEKWLQQTHKNTVLNFQRMSSHCWKDHTPLWDSMWKYRQGFLDHYEKLRQSANQTDLFFRCLSGKVLLTIASKSKLRDRINNTVIIIMLFYQESL